MNPDDYKDQASTDAARERGRQAWMTCHGLTLPRPMPRAATGGGPALRQPNAANETAPPIYCGGTLRNGRNLVSYFCSSACCTATASKGVSQCAYRPPSREIILSHVVPPIWGVQHEIWKDKPPARTSAGSGGSLTAQPYEDGHCSPLGEGEKAWMAIADRYGLAFTSSVEDAWHFPGTVLWALWLPVEGP